MGWLSVLVCAIPVVLLYGSGWTLTFMLAIANVIINLWSFGVMHNYAAEEPAQRIRRLRENLEAEGRWDVETGRRLDEVRLNLDSDAIPSWLTMTNMVSAALGVVLLIYSLMAI